MSYCRSLLRALESGERSVCASLRLARECGGGRLAAISEDAIERARRLAEVLRRLGKNPSLDQLFSLDDELIDALLDPLVSTLAACMTDGGEAP